MKFLTFITVLALYTGPLKAEHNVPQPPGSAEEDPYAWLSNIVDGTHKVDPKNVFRKAIQQLDENTGQCRFQRKPDESPYSSSTNLLNGYLAIAIENQFLKQGKVDATYSDMIRYVRESGGYKSFMDGVVADLEKSDASYALASFKDEAREIADLNSEVKEFFLHKVSENERALMTKGSVALETETLSVQGREANRRMRSQAKIPSKLSDRLDQLAALYNLRIRELGREKMHSLPEVRQIERRIDGGEAVSRMLSHPFLKGAESFKKLNAAVEDQTSEDLARYLKYQELFSGALSKTERLFLKHQGTSLDKRMVTLYDEHKEGRPEVKRFMELRSAVEKFRDRYRQKLNGNFYQRFRTEIRNEAMTKKMLDSITPDSPMRIAVFVDEKTQELKGIQVIEFTEPPEKAGEKFVIVPLDKGQHYGQGGTYESLTPLKRHVEEITGTPMKGLLSGFTCSNYRANLSNIPEESDLEYALIHELHAIGQTDFGWEKSISL